MIAALALLCTEKKKGKKKEFEVVGARAILIM